MKSYGMKQATIQKNGHWITEIIIVDVQTGEIINQLGKEEYQIIGEKINADATKMIKTITKLARKTNTKQLKLDV